MIGAGALTQVVEYWSAHKESWAQSLAWTKPGVVLCTPVILALKKWKQVDQQFKVIPGCMVRMGPT